MYKIEETTEPSFPRERLAYFGAEKLSDIELLAIILRTGSPPLSVKPFAEQLLKTFGGLEKLAKASHQELLQVPGIGPSKAAELRATFELGQRLLRSQREQAEAFAGIADFSQQLIEEMEDLTQEHLVAVYLDAKNRVLQKRTIFIGTVDHSLANPREVLHYAVKCLAVGLIVVHNHPSGDPKPSQADKLFTKKMQEASLALGIHFLDHLIIGRQAYYSFAERKLI